MGSYLNSANSYMLYKKGEVSRIFNVTGACIPKLHYMVNIQGCLEEIRTLVDSGAYFTINRARQIVRAGS